MLHFLIVDIMESFMDYRFIVDTMLGKLGRWLLLLGYDVEYFRGEKDEEMIALSKKEDRIIITRDTHLALERFPEKSFLVKSTRFWEQLGRVIRSFPLDFSKTFMTRCPRCNVLTKPVRKEDVIGELPEKVKTWATVCFRCPECGHLYWDGTHAIEMMRLLKENLGIEFEPENLKASPQDFN